MEERPPLTPRMERTLRRALEIARANGQAVVGTEHVILAFLDDRRGIAGAALEALGVSDALRDRIVRIITSEGYHTPSKSIGDPTSRDIR